jgi:hypothetical protein
MNFSISFCDLWRLHCYAPQPVVVPPAFSSPLARDVERRFRRTTADTAQTTLRRYSWMYIVAGSYALQILQGQSSSWVYSCLPEGLRSAPFTLDAFLVHFLDHPPSKGVIGILVFQRIVWGVTGSRKRAILVQLTVHRHTRIRSGRGDFC